MLLRGESETKCLEQRQKDQQSLTQRETQSKSLTVYLQSHTPLWSVGHKESVPLDLVFQKCLLEKRPKFIAKYY